MISILFLAADPTDASRLRLGEEAREIQEKLQLSKWRDKFALHHRMSVRPADISQALLDVNPQIVHFSGHGTNAGALCIENKLGETHPIQPEALEALFEQFANQLDCVVLNACYSVEQAKAIARHVRYVIGMNQTIGDKAAIAFSIGFYQALGAGRSIEEAYKLGCVQIRLENIPEHLTPALITITTAPVAAQSADKDYNWQISPAKTIKVALWGPQAAGKTTYIVAVWGACLTYEARWFASPDDDLTSDFVIDKLTQLRKGNFPEPTRLQSKPTEYSFFFAPRSKQENKGEEQIESPLQSFRDWIVTDDVKVPASDATNTSLTVSFADVAGEHYFIDPIDSPLWESIWNCDGLICLLDPAEASDHIGITLRLVQNLRLKSKEEPARRLGHYLPHYVAVCFSKIDHPQFYQYRDKPIELNNILAQETGIDLYAILGANFMPERIRFFCISAIGVDSNGQSLVNEYGIVAPNKIRPINVIAPLRWLFESFQSK